MPMQETSLPVGATALKFSYNGRDYSILLDTDSFDRAGEDGDIPVIPLCRGCEFVGEVLPGEWKKGWGADISVFTARIDGGVLELGGLYDGTGADPDGWIDGHHPIPLMDSTVVTVELESPTNDTDDAPGSGDNIKTEFYIRQDKAVNSPDDDDNYLSISIDVTAAGLLMEVIEEIGGAANTIFTGSTYDDASVRDDAADQFTIWRIVFHDGVAGATAPEDVRHIHIYLKQGVDRAGAEAATENELTTSPYAIDDYLFDVGYPAYRIYTTDTGYFGDEVGSGHEAISTYLRVDYPSLFSLKYDFLDADVGKGDVELWDGDPDVSTSVQVFDEDHVFTGDAYLQNGLLRLQIDDKPASVIYGLKLYYWTGAAWVQPFDRLYFHQRTDLENLRYPFLQSIEGVSSEKITLKVRLENSAVEDSAFYVDTKIILERGKLYIVFETISVFPSQDVNTEFLENGSRFRFGFVGDVDAHGLGDDDLNLTALNTTMTDNFAVIFDDAGTAVLGFVASTEKPDGATFSRMVASDGGEIIWQDIAVTTFPNFKQYTGIIPFSLVANLFKEAETGDYTGTTPGNDPNASPPAGNNYVLLDAIGNFQTPAGEYSTYQFDAGTHLPEGRYLAVIRARYVDVETMRMYVWNDDDDVYRNEENAKVTKTLAATFGYHSVVFDITAADVTGTDTLAIVAEKSTDDTDEIRIDYMLIVPIGDGESLPQDCSHGAMRGFNKPKRLYVR